MLLLLVSAISVLNHVGNAGPIGKVDEVAGDNSDGAGSWAEYYLKKYGQETDENSLFETGDDTALKDYYDYIDHMDEEEREEILHEQAENEGDSEVTDDTTADEIFTDESLTHESFTDEKFTGEKFTHESFTNEKFTDENFTDETFTGDIFTDEISPKGDAAVTESISRESRTETPENATQTQQPAFQPIPLSGRFDHYDVIERDKLITLEELAFVTSALENIRQAFKESDTNGGWGRIRFSCV
jgi:hypothetical protein